MNWAKRKIADPCEPKYLRKMRRKNQPRLRDFATCEPWLTHQDQPRFASKIWFLVKILSRSRLLARPTSGGEFQNEILKNLRFFRIWYILGTLCREFTIFTKWKLPTLAQFSALAENWVDRDRLFSPIPERVWGRQTVGAYQKSA